MSMSIDEICLIDRRIQDISYTLVHEKNAWRYELLLDRLNRLSSLIDSPIPDIALIKERIGDGGKS